MRSGDEDDQPGSGQKADAVIQGKVQKRWQSYVWDTLDKSPEERRFLFKLDFALLTFASLGKPSKPKSLRLSQWLTLAGYFIKYLDQANINNAFVSGM